ncbi:MAG: HD domain-containing protein [Cyanobacteria bacterium J06639_1]
MTQNARKNEIDLSEERCKNSQVRAVSFQTVDEAYLFLEELGASAPLVLHVKLVGEAAELLIAKLHDLDIQFDERFVCLGVAFHDVGKILHSQELVERGKLHEAHGEQLLIARGVDPALARCCRSHGQWQTMVCSFEEICVALADTLWKGKRNPDLEERLVRMTSTKCQKDYWELFIELDACFEAIAAEGDSRLLRSRVSS